MPSSLRCAAAFSPSDGLYWSLMTQSPRNPTRSDSSTNRRRHSSSGYRAARSSLLSLFVVTAPPRTRAPARLRTRKTCGGSGEGALPYGPRRLAHGHFPEDARTIHNINRPCAVTLHNDTIHIDGLRISSPTAVAGARREGDRQPDGLDRWAAQIFEIGAGAATLATGALDLTALQTSLERFADSVNGTAAAAAAELRTGVEQLLTGDGTGVTAVTQRALTDLSSEVAALVTGSEAPLPAAVTKAVADVTGNALSEIHRALAAQAERRRRGLPGPKGPGHRGVPGPRERDRRRRRPRAPARRAAVPRRVRPAPPADPGGGPRRQRRHPDQRAAQVRADHAGPRSAPPAGARHRRGHGGPGQLAPASFGATTGGAPTCTSRAGTACPRRGGRLAAVSSRRAYQHYGARPLGQLPLLRIWARSCAASSGAMAPLSSSAATRSSCVSLSPIVPVVAA